MRAARPGDCWRWRAYDVEVDAWLAGLAMASRSEGGDYSQLAIGLQSLLKAQVQLRRLACALDAADVQRIGAYFAPPARAVAPAAALPRKP